MKQIDYLKLVATGRKSIHYARPGEADQALTGLIGYGFVFSLLLTFAAVFLAAYLGKDLLAYTIGQAVAATLFPALAYFVASIFIGGAPRIVRVCMIAIGASVLVLLLFALMTDRLDIWYLFLPPFLYSLLVALGAFRQL